MLRPFPASEEFDPWDLVVRQRRSRSHSDHVVILIDEFEVIPREKVRDRRKLGAVAGGVVVQLEEGNCEKLHVLGNGEDLYTRR